MQLELSKNYLQTDNSELKKEDIEKLAKLLAYHSDLYYNQNTTIISDYEYDMLLKKLEFLEEKFAVQKKKSETIGAEAKVESSFAKVAHSRPMISLGNTYNTQDLQDFDERVGKQLTNKKVSTNQVKSKEKKSINSGIKEQGDKNGLLISDNQTLTYCLEYKFDGLGVELIYKNGFFTQAITRGNGLVGEDITENVMQIENIPKEISYKDDLEVRGEVVLPLSEFERINAENLKTGEKVFSNPRNAASGSLRTKDISVTKKRKLKFFAYDLANFGEFVESLTNTSHSLHKTKKKITYFQVIQSLETLGFEISPYFKIFHNIEEIIYEIENIGDYKKDIDFEVDGLVIKVNEIELWEQIGWTEHHPRYATAYKFPAEIFTTKILSVDIQVGRTGTITPVANLESVNIGGVNVKRATLHNYDEVEKLGVKVGDYVFIKRAGEVIPKIVSVASSGEKTEKIHIPATCPSCGTPVQKDEDKVRYYCPNTQNCPAQHSEKLIFAVGKNGFDIDGIGEKQIKLFLEIGLIHNLVDIFKLGEKKDEILALEGYREKSVNNMIESLEVAKNIDISKLLVALGISGVGKKTAKNISKLFVGVDDLLQFHYSLEDLENIEDIGPEIAQNIYNYFNDEYNKKLLLALSEILKISYFQKKEGEKHSFFTAKKVCITGSFEYHGEKISRDILIQQLEEVGGSFVSSVSKNTDFLLAGEKAGSKLKKAESLGVVVLDLKGFYEKI